MNSKGFVFISVLIFLQIFSLLGLYALFNTRLHLRMIGEMEQQKALLRQSKNIVSMIEKQFAISTPHCLVATLPMSELVQKPVGWWEQFACTGQLPEMRYYFVIESLGSDPCGRIREEEDHRSVADYYRMTLLSLPATIKHTKIILQSSLVKGISATSSCDYREHWVHLGRQMWREIY